MTNRRKSGKKERTPELREDHPEKIPPGDDQVIPVCLGEFGLKEAEGFARLWESTWSQDKRAPRKKK